MPAAPKDFHYMTVLRELEKAVVELHPDPKVTKVSNYPLANLVGKLYDKVTNLKSQWESLEEKIDFQLGAEQQRQIKAEDRIVAHINKLTDDLHRDPKHRRLVGHWPPMVPVARLVERFTALTIGLHSEAPEKPFRQHVTAAFREAVLPGLAWGLMIRLYSLPQSSRPALKEALVRRLRGQDTAEDHLLVKKEKVRLDYLPLVEAWFDILQKKSLGEVNSSEVGAVRIELAQLMAKDLGDLDTELWERLGNQYLSTIAGAERALAVARAQNHSAGTAAFLRERLELFEAARKPELQVFRHQTDIDLPKALTYTFAVVSAAPGNTNAGEEACGGAFWLARATFARHIADDLDKRKAASTKVLSLLMRGGLMFNHLPRESDRLLTCLRYAAGFATNPRYVRSEAVLHYQERFIDLYAEHPLHRPALVELFRGRMAWQLSFATKDPAIRKKALKHYFNALSLHQNQVGGFDAEAPVHFFPELTLLLRLSATREHKETKTLEAVDFITQRNYGVYFDIEFERDAITGGLKAFKEYHDWKGQALAAESPLSSSSAFGRKQLASFKQATASPEIGKILEDSGAIQRSFEYNR